MHCSGFGESGSRLTVYLTEPSRGHHSDRLAGILTPFHSAGTSGVQTALYELVEIVPQKGPFVKRKPYGFATGAMLTGKRKGPIIINAAAAFVFPAARAFRHRPQAVILQRRIPMDLFLYFAELVGTAAFALSGALLAIQKKLDLFGVLFLAVITALGGGTIRDVLLGRIPPRMFYSGWYVLLSVAVALIMFLAARWSHGRLTRFGVWADRALNFCDALGLGIFAVIGTQAVGRVGYADNAFLSIFMGMITGVGGGVLRDMMCGDIPFVLRKHIYALAAIMGSIVYYVPVRLDLLTVYSATLLGVAVTVALRLLARHYRWNLPHAEV